ncbi:MAG: NADH-quinone oxidoreductase subunit G [Alphaproteobacteria bacterium]|nr:NADH-quinone oxidoreductase subunit G [Alphaproteobacteria bacterium]
MAKVIIDGVEHDFDPDLTILQACEEAGAEIPRFCYHERLSIAGNCRMCLVEWEGAPKPIASCAMAVKDLRPNRDGSPARIRTSSPTVRKAREGVMEFLLINHPLDCPICDQGGECDLQDQAMAYGHDDFHRFDENKRAVDDKYMGPLIKTIMTRCIHCTRCIRFATEVAGVSELGATGRGEDMEITTYLEKALASELSGNVIDLCPVGALTSKPYAFTTRPWELRKTESIDVMDALGSNIRVDVRGREVMRILPRLHEDVNEEWISDKSRFIWDGLRKRRLDRPYVRRDGRLEPATWAEALGAVAEKMKATDPARMAALVGDLPPAEAIYALKALTDRLGIVHRDCRQDGAQLSGSPREAYLFNTTIAGIEAADACLLIGTNPRREAAVLNARLRKRWLMGAFEVGLIGEAVDLTYDYAHLGTGPDTLEALARGEGAFAQVLDRAARPMLVLGMGALARPDGAAVLRLAAELAGRTGMIVAGEGEAAGWNGFNVLHTAAARVAAMDIGFLPGEKGRDTTGILAGAEAGEIELVYLLGADEFDPARLEKPFVIYQGHHGDAGAHAADVILPGAAYVEQAGLYVNTEGRVQQARRASFPPGEAREDWAILRALSERLGMALPFDTLSAAQGALAGAVPGFTTIDHAPGAMGARPGMLASVGTKGALHKAPFRAAVSDFYRTNPIARASAVMAECAALFAGGAVSEAAE